MSATTARQSDASLREQGESIVQKLYKAHNLSRAIDFMTEVSIGDFARRADTFRASIEEVNDVIHDIIVAAIDEAEHLVRKLPGEE